MARKKGLKKPLKNKSFRVVNKLYLTGFVFSLKSIFVGTDDSTAREFIRSGRRGRRPLLII